MTALYQHPNSELALCSTCVDAVRDYTPQQRLRRLWLRVDDGECVRCAALPPLDLAWMRQNTSVRHGVCTQVVKSTDPTMPSLVFVYGVPEQRSVELRSTTAHPAVPWEAFE